LAAGPPIKKENMKNTQNQQILQYFKDGGSLTPLSALKLFGCFRIGARAWDIAHGKADGINYPIVSEMVKDEATGKRFAKYHLFCK